MVYTYIHVIFNTHSVLSGPSTFIRVAKKLYMLSIMLHSAIHHSTCKRAIRMYGCLQPCVHTQKIGMLYDMLYIYKYIFQFQQIDSLACTHSINLKYLTWMRKWLKSLFLYILYNVHTLLVINANELRDMSGLLCTYIFNTHNDLHTYL